jgi:hypothetical protein
MLVLFSREFPKQNVRSGGSSGPSGRLLPQAGEDWGEGQPQHLFISQMKLA